MLSRPRLDPFSARLHAIHQKRRAANPPPPPHEEHDAQGLDVAQEVGECVDACHEPVLDLEPVNGAVSTGCAECGGVGANNPVDELRQEIAAMKERIAVLEARVADLEDGDQVMYRSA